MTLKRFENWPDRLDRFLAGAKSESFSWGQWDCGLFAAAAIDAMTGTDLGEAYRGKYSTATGAARAMKEAGHNDLEGVATAMLGKALKTPLKAQRGDIVLSCEEAGGALGVVDVSGRHFQMITDQGLMRFSMDMAVKAWRV